MALGLIFGIGSIFLTAALPAEDQAQTHEQKSISDKPKAPEEKKLCRRVVPTGSVMPVRICLTKTEWQYVNGINREAYERARGVKLQAER